VVIIKVLGVKHKPKLFIMKIYTVNKWYHTADNYGYQSGETDFRILSYHSTLKSAEDKIKSFSDYSETITDENEETNNLYFISSVIVE
jgi:hypothetical protein